MAYLHCRFSHLKPVFRFKCAGTEHLYCHEYKTVESQVGGCSEMQINS